VVLVTERGQALRFSEKQVRSMGRSAAGVTGIRLAKGDLVASLEVVEPDADLLVVTASGYGKRTPLSEYPVKSRGTGGVATINRDSLEKIGIISAARVVQEADDLTVISTGGQVLRTMVKHVARAGRTARGSRLIVLTNGERVASLARISAADLRSIGASPDSNGGGNSNSKANGEVGES
jgi:DNA gyrase subunit A